MVDLRRFSQRCFRDERGSIGIVGVFMLPVLIAGLAFGVEMSSWRTRQVQLATIADALAYTAAIMKRDGAGEAEIRQRAHLQALANGLDAARGTIAVAFDADGAASITISERQHRTISALFAKGDVVMAKAAAAEASEGSSACLIALSPTGSALAFGGSTNVRLRQCVAASNSAAPDAVDRSGSATVSLDCVLAVGGITGLQPGDTLCAETLTGIAPIRDPLRELPEPTTLAACSARKTGGAKSITTFSPGLCSDKQWKGDVVLDPGIYVFDTDIQLNAGTSVTGTDVTLVFRAGADMRINGNAFVSLTAPQTGPTKDLLLFGRNGGGFQHNGTAGLDLNGIVYFPTTPVGMNGDALGRITCTRIIAWTISYSGSSDFDSACVGGGPGRDDLVVNAYAKLTG